MNGPPSIRRRLARAARAALLGLVVVFALPSPEALADSLREVAERIAREHDGKVVSARVVERGGRRFYVIRILTRDGVVRTFRIPADDRNRLAQWTPGLVGAVSDRDSNSPGVANRSSLPQHRAPTLVGAASDRDSNPPGIANRSSLPQHRAGEQR